MRPRAYYDRKIEVLTHYGNGKCACIKCGFWDARALSIDHINGGGSKHIKSLGKPFYDWLVENNYPDGYQTLCMNCQWIKKAESSKQQDIRQGYPLTLEDIKDIYNKCFPRA